MLFRARAQLTEAHLDLSGWQLSGRYRRTISLDRIVHVDLKGSKELVLWLVDGEVVRLRINNADVWKRELSLGH
jgi:hypothetical protein